MRTRSRLALVTLCIAVGLAAFPGAAAAEEPPNPRLDRIDYANPAALPALPASVGAGKRTQGIARQLATKGQDPRGTLSQIVRWVGRNLRSDPSKAGQWRTVDQVLVDGSAGSQADRALVIGVMARSVGIPTAWVKTLPMAFVNNRDSVKPDHPSAVGRTFLEVHVGGRWQLLDPVTARLYETYAPKTRLLPDEYLAFDKGSDPHALVLPNRRSLYVAQVRAYVRRLRAPEKPWSRAHDLLSPWRVYVTGRGGAATYASAACKTLGFLVGGVFDSRFEANLAAARGKTLIVTCREKRPVLPESLWGAWLPPGHREILSGAKKIDKGWVAHRLADGTRVILIVAAGYGPVELAVSEALEG